MLRLLGAGLLGGLVLMIWSVVFSTLGPAREASPASERAAATIDSFRERVEQVEFELPFGPATVQAATAEPPPAPVHSAPPLDLATLARSLGMACGAALLAAVLMSWFGGAKRPFSERVFFAVLLGGFAGLAMMIPAGGWTEFSGRRTALYMGEVLVGWTLAGMVIAVMLNPRSKKQKA